MSSRVAVSAVLLLFVLPWTAATVAFDVLAISGMVRQVQSAGWPSVQGTITRSEVETVRSSKSTTHGLKVAYTYSVDGQRYEGSQYRSTSWRSGDREYAEGLVARFPAGATVPVYYRPGQPSEAVLQPGLEGSELFLLMLLLPFNLVALFLGALVVRTWRPEPPLLATFFREDGSECVTLGAPSPAGSVLLALGGSALVCVVLGGATVGFSPPLLVAVGAWGAVIASGMFAGLRTRARVRSGYYDVRLHTEARSLSLPPVSGRKRRLDVRWSDVRSLRVEHRVRTRRGRKLTWYHPTLELAAPGGQVRQEVIAAFGSQEQAEAMARWLHSYLRCGHEATQGERRSA